MRALRAFVNAGACPIGLRNCVELGDKDSFISTVTCRALLHDAEVPAQGLPR